MNRIAAPSVSAPCGTVILEHLGFTSTYDDPQTEEGVIGLTLATMDPAAIDALVHVTAQQLIESEPQRDYPSCVDEAYKYLYALRANGQAEIAKMPAN